MASDLNFETVEVVEAFAKKTIADLAGVTERTVGHWIKKGILGPPDSQIDGQELWHRAQVEAALTYHRDRRNRQGTATRKALGQYG